MSNTDLIHKAVTEFLEKITATYGVKVTEISADYETAFNPEWDKHYVLTNISVTIKT